MMISVEDAWKLLSDHKIDPGHESISIADANHRILAKDAVARVSRPDAAVSAMDGYAVRLNDVMSAGATLQVIGESPAGHPFGGQVSAGEAVRIFTGGILPRGADHVIIQENVTRDGDQIHIDEAAAKHANVRQAGRDFSAGDTIISANTKLGPAELALMASANLPNAIVKRRLKVGLIANGDELKPPGSELRLGEIVNSNVYGLTPLIESWGGEAIDLGIATDTLAAIQERITSRNDIDVYLPVGGASVGDHDHMKQAFAEEGFEPVFKKIAVCPGKPTWFSTNGRSRVIGLPGNPASAFVCAHLFLRPFLTGFASPPLVTARLTTDLPANGPREHYMRAYVSISQSGQLEARQANDQDSSLISPFRDCKALIRCPVSAPAKQIGDQVELLLTENIIRN